MAVQASVYPEHRGHLFGDVPVLLVVAAVFAFLTPRKKESKHRNNVPKYADQGDIISKHG